MSESNPFATASILPFQAPPFNRIKDSDYQPAIEEGMKQNLAEIEAIADSPSAPTFANTMTKRMLAMEWAMSVEEAIEAEAVAQALCMTTEDFARAFDAFSQKKTPAFQGD